MRKAHLEVQMDIEGDIDEDFMGGFGAAVVGAARDVLHEHKHVTIKRASWFTEIHELDDPVVPYDSGCRFNWKPQHRHRWILWTTDDDIPVEVHRTCLAPTGTPTPTRDDLIGEGRTYWWEEICLAQDRVFRYEPFKRSSMGHFDEHEPLP